MSPISRLYESGIFFWILWGIELAFMLWWYLDELKYTYLSVNPSVYYGFLWLLAALVFQTALSWKGLALAMVGLGALPLAIMGLYLLVVLIATVFGGPIRWN
ncbi:MAG: hypothetical protein IT270_13055 [Saprospiraceae bacterium]|nr:hypothetical protein [Saprospiraceae bacterium]